MYRPSRQTPAPKLVAAFCFFAFSFLLVAGISWPWSSTAHAGRRVDDTEGTTASSSPEPNRSSAFALIRMMNEVATRSSEKTTNSFGVGPNNAKDLNSWIEVSGSVAGTEYPLIALGTTLTVNKKLVSSTNITIGAPVVYEVEVKSSHPTTYNSLSLKDTLPPGFTFVSATYALSGATGPTSAAALNSGTNVLTLGNFTLSTNGIITVTITGYFTTGGPKPNLVVADDSLDPVPAGTPVTNIGTDTETVSFNSFPVDLKVEKCVSSGSTCGPTSSVSFPGLLHYQITVTNKTAQPVYLGGLLTIRDFLTNNSSIPVKWTASGFTCSASGGAACPDLPAATSLATLGAFSTAAILSFKYDSVVPEPNDSGLMPGNASYKIDFDINLTTAATCAPTTVNVQNQARLDLSNGVQNLTDQFMPDNTSQPTVVTTVTTNLGACPSPSPTPSPSPPLTVNKVLCSTLTGPCVPSTAAGWNAPVRYQVTVNNPNSAQSFLLIDNIYKTVGTPTFKASVSKGPCLSAGCTALTSPTLLTTPVLNTPTVNVDNPNSFTLWTGTVPSFSGSQIIEYVVNYEPICESDSSADRIFNYCSILGVSSTAQANLPETGLVCDLSVTKTETPPGPILFGQPHAYKVVFANPSSSAMDVLVRDVLSVKSNRYGTVPFDYSVSCAATQGTITPLTSPPLPLVKNVTGASATYQSAGWRGVKLINEQMNFGPASTLTCQVTVTAHQLPDTNPHCQGADNPQLATDDPKLVNFAYMDPNTFNENGATAPPFSSWVESDLPLCRNVIVHKTADAHSFVPGGTITYTITVENKGDDPVASLALKDVIQLPLVATSVGACTPPNCTAGPTLSTGLSPQVDVSYGLLQPNAPVSFPLTVTAPQAGGSYLNEAVASFPPGGNFYFQGDPTKFLKSEENIQVLTPALSKLFDPPQIGPNGTSTLTFNITNLNGDPKQTGMSFSDTLPAGLQIVSVVSNGCSGNVSVSSDGHTVTLTGGQLIGPNADGSGKHACQISVKVKASDACGVLKNTRDNFSHVANLDVSNIDEQLTVVGCALKPPTLAKKFDPPKIPLNGTTTLAFTITNSSGDPKQTGIAFSDTLPPGLQVVSVVSSGCSGAVTISPDGHTITLTGGQLVGPNADGSGKHSCQIIVKVQATGACGVYRNTKDNFSQVTNLDVSGINEQLEVGDCPPPTDSCEVKTNEISCKADGTGGYLYTFTLTNNTGHVVTDVLLTPAPNSGITINPRQPSLPPGGIAVGASLTLSASINGGKPEQPACFDVTLMTKDGDCCTTRVCPVLPECCAVAKEESIECNKDGTFTYTLSIVNTGLNTIEHIYLYPPAGVTMTPNYFSVSLKPGDTFTTKVLIKGAKPGDKLCFGISLHTANMENCCQGQQCIVLPACPVPAVRSP